MIGTRTLPTHPRRLFFNPLETSQSDLGNLQLITCLLISYPLGSVFVRVPSVGLKHAFNISVTLFYLLPMLNMYNALLQLLLDILVTYFLAKGMKDKRMPWLVFMCVLFIFETERVYSTRGGVCSFVMGHLLIKYACASCGHSTISLTRIRTAISFEPSSISVTKLWKSQVPKWSSL
jgi:hypothetical protein